MDNHIITILQKFEKPHDNFFKDKECLICLETFELESNKIVKLPCKCSNSVYHIVCIVKLLQSGENKNFCPHCKNIYKFPLQQIQVSGNQPLSYIVFNTQITQSNQQDIYNLQAKYFTNILVFHILSNSIMNIISIIASNGCAKNNNNPEELQVLMLFYFCKLFFNYCILTYSKNNIEKIEDSLVYSYMFQFILFCFLIYTLTKIKNDSNSTILLLNNILLSLFDLSYRIIIVYRMRNNVNILG
jgi:hypothetical protein